MQALRQSDLTQVVLIHTNSAEKPEPVRSFLLPFLTLLLLYCSWVFSLRVFPTQDDAIHLYYVNVIKHLLSGHGDFAAFYVFQHPLPPYILHYALLYGLTNFMHPVVAEKCVVCLILVTAACGFRFLSMAVGRNGGLMSLWVVPLTLSWPLFMGFHNYCLAMGLSFWGWGCWLRARKEDGHTYRYKAAFLLLIALILFTHPVPLLFLLTVISVDLAAQVAHGWLRLRRPLLVVLAPLKGCLITAAVAFSSLFYLALFVDRAHSSADLTQSVSRLSILLTFVKLRWMTFASGGLVTQGYRLALYGVLVLSFRLALRDIGGRWNERRLVNSDVVLLCSAGLMLLMPLLPPNMNGSEHFSDRLSMLVWVAALAAASRTQSLGKQTTRLMACAACVFGLATLALANRFVTPAANEVYAMESVPLAPQGIGLLFDSPNMIDDGRLTFNPFLRWEGGRIFRRMDAILLNDPWVSPPYPLPLRRKANVLTAGFSPRDFVDPGFLYQHLMRSSKDREALLRHIDFIVFVGKRKGSAAIADPLIGLDRNRTWICDSQDVYSVCRANGGKSSAFGTETAQMTKLQRAGGG